jgi:hypothetical protein
MNVQHNLGVFANSARVPLYVIDNDILQAQQTTPAGLQKISSLDAWVKAFRQQLHKVNTLTPTRHLDLFEFCLGDLLQHLQFLGTGKHFLGTFSAELKERIKFLKEKSSKLAGALTNSSEEPLSLSNVLQIFQAPCVVRQGLVVPLELTSFRDDQTKYAAISGLFYQELPHRAQPLINVVAKVQQVLMARRTNNETVGNSNTMSPSQFLLEVESLISLLGPIQCGHYQAIYRDCYHELQYSQGCFALVRGPVKVRGQLKSLYVGLHITSTKRAQWLLRPPFCAPNRQGFWKGPGIPAGNGMCMGRPEQYRNLLSQRFTDAEALVQWIDAGVDRATGRSPFHRNWRAKMQQSVVAKNSASNRRKEVLARCRRQAKASQLSR